MARGDVANLVPEHARQLGLGVDVYQQAAIDVDVAAAGGERVDGFVVDDEELEFLVGQVADLRDALAHQVHVFLRGLIVVQTQRLDDFLVVLLDGLLLAVHGAHDDVLAAGRGIGCAARDKDGRCRKAEGEQWSALHVFSLRERAERVFNYDIAPLQQVPDRYPDQEGSKKAPASFRRGAPL